MQGFSGLFHINRDSFELIPTCRPLDFIPTSDIFSNLFLLPKFSILFLLNAFRTYSYFRYIFELIPTSKVFDLIPTSDIFSNLFLLPKFSILFLLQIYFRTYSYFQSFRSYSYLMPFEPIPTSDRLSNLFLLPKFSNLFLLNAFRSYSYFRYIFELIPTSKVFELIPICRPFDLIPTSFFGLIPTSSFELILHYPLSSPFPVRNPRKTSIFTRTGTLKTAVISRDRE